MAITNVIKRVAGILFLLSAMFALNGCFISALTKMQVGHELMPIGHDRFMEGVRYSPRTREVIFVGRSDHLVSPPAGASRIINDYDFSQTISIPLQRNGSPVDPPYYSTSTSVRNLFKEYNIVISEVDRCTIRVNATTTFTDHLCFASSFLFYPFTIAGDTVLTPIYIIASLSNDQIAKFYGVSFYGFLVADF